MFHEVTKILSRQDYRIKLWLCAGLSGLCAIEWSVHSWQSASMTKNLATTISSTNYQAHELPSIENEQTSALAFDDLVNRPLFNKGRTVDAEQEEIADVKTEIQNGELDEWYLVGIYFNNGEHRVLFSHKLTPKKHLKLELNDSIGNWTLSEISDEHVIFTQNQQQRIIELRKQKHNAKQASVRNINNTPANKQTKDNGESQSANTPVPIGTEAGIQNTSESETINESE